MNLEKLYHETKSKAILLIDENGKIVESYSDIEQKKSEDFSAVTMVIVNMLDDYLREVLSVMPLKEIIIKTEQDHFYIRKYKSNHILCALSDSSINISLISLALRKKLN